MMNSSFKEIFQKFFKSGNPAMFYIGINVVLFLLVNIVGSLIFLSTKEVALQNIFRSYVAFPANLIDDPFKIYTIATYFFFHTDLFSLLLNCLWLFWMGSLFLQFLKARQFHVVYWGGAIFGAIAFALISAVNTKVETSAAFLIGSSAATMAVFTAVVTLVPNYSLRLMLFGNVKLKFLWLAYFVLMALGTLNAITLSNTVATLAGAFFGFLFIRILQKGKDLSTFFERKPKLKVVRNEAPKQRERIVNQDEIDAILDKISKTGYDRLTTKEKQTLFDASKN